MKSLIRWAGGKQSINKIILKYFPLEESVKTYYEPFFGGGTLFFSSNFSKAFLSDSNEQLINFYNNLRTNPNELHQLFINFSKIMNMDYYYFIRNKYNNSINIFDVYQAARFFVLNKYSYNGIYRVNKKNEYNVPFGKPTPRLPTTEEISMFSQKLQHSTLKACDYQSIASYITKNDFVYLDPPYPPINGTSMFRHYTADRFLDSDQEKLLSFCNDLTKRNIRFLMSNASTNRIKQLYKQYNTVTIEKTRFVTCKKERLKVQELIIFNFK